MSAPIDRHDGRYRGERRRDNGMALAALHKRRAIWRDTVAFVDAILASPTGEATTDDTVTDYGEPYHDGGKWRGSVVRTLLAARLIEDSGRSIRSAREHRHGARLPVWRVVDRERLATCAQELGVLLATYPEPPPLPPGAQSTLWPVDPPRNENGPAGATAGPRG